ncbi:MAG: GTP-binding protein [archaeon]|jgi:hypothetical protein|nr:GTP-binding protein [Euryarchaeota archaeon]MDP7260741.1 GTP-binding protein [archaeon]|tara:strand:- start:35585 stop:36658 length:1074 start_codon:yes stop_codon:yes gene_type:complete
MSVEDKIKEIEDEIRKTSYNKATQHHIGKLKAKLSKLRASAEKGSSQGGGLGYGIKKSGDATVIFAGFPSVGKSTLLNALTNAKSEVGHYDFTTLTVVPGAMKYKSAELQLLDVPGLIAGAASGKGRGREVLSVIRMGDLLCLVIDANKPEQYKQMLKELYDANLRLDERPPRISIEKRAYGGIQIEKISKCKLANSLIKSVLSEFGYLNASITIQDAVDLDQLIDGIVKNRVYLPSLVIVNKSDSVKELPKLHKEQVSISAKEGEGLEDLKESIFTKLQLIRIFMKPQGEKADLEEPLLVKADSTVGEVCSKLHKTFRKNFRYAMVTGKSAKFANQKAGLNHVLKDGDLLTIVQKR